MVDFASGAKLWDVDGNDHILDLHDGLDFLNPRQDGIALLKKIGLSGFAAKSPKFEWTETQLAARGETVTLADGTGTSLTVADTGIYQVNELIRIENEIVRVTAIASATVLTIVRGYAGTTGAAHSSKLAFSLGSADPQNSDAPAGVSDEGDRLYNYTQTFTRAVELSNDEIAQASTEGNPLVGQVERRFIEANRQLARALLYGVRHSDTTNNITVTGGLKQFVTTNVDNVAGALTLADIDAQILAIVNAGGNPDVMVLSPYQKQKLDALDADLVRTGKKDAQSRVGGNPNVMTWQSGILDYEIDLIVDHSVLTDELWILDTSNVKIGHLSNNGVNGQWHVENAENNGQDGRHKVIRGKYGVKVEQQKAHAYLYGLS